MQQLLSKYKKERKYPVDQYLILHHKDQVAKKFARVIRIKEYLSIKAQKESQNSLEKSPDINTAVE